MKRLSPLLLAVFFFAVGGYLGIRSYEHFVFRPDTDRFRIECQWNQSLHDLDVLRRLRLGNTEEAIRALERDLSLRIGEVRELLPNERGPFREVVIEAVSAAEKYQGQYPTSTNWEFKDSFVRRLGAVTAAPGVSVPITNYQKDAK